MILLELLALVPLALIILTIVGFGILSNNRNSLAAKMMIMPGLIVFTFFAGLIFNLIFSFTSSYREAINIFVFILCFLFVVVITCAVWGFIKKKAVYIPLIICSVVCLITTGILIACDTIDSNIPSLREGDDIILEYLPFYDKESKVALLDEESTLHITDDKPVMDGATALYPIYSAFAKATYPEDTLNFEYVYCNTTPWAYELIVDGDVDIIYVFGPSQEQEQYAADNGVELVYTPIGKEAFVFFVNSQNPIDNLTLEQVQAIYSGEITDWEDLGVKGFGEIRAFQRNEGSGSQSNLIRIMDGKKLMEAPEENVVKAMGGIISQTADYKNYKNAIGFSFRFYSTEMVANDQIKLLSINGVAPTAENIENGTYPLSSDFYAVTRSDADENTKKLVEWILSEQGQELIEKTGYTPINK